MIYDVEIDISPAFGWQSNVVWNTEVVPMRYGREYRNAIWTRPKHSFILPLQNITSADYRLFLKSLFLTMRGQTFAFLGHDRSDDQAVGADLGDAPSGSAAVQLRKLSVSGTAEYERIIERPVAGTVTVYQDGVEKAGTIDTETGLFTPDTAWTEGLPLTADFHFRVPVRFASDVLSMTIDERFGGDGDYAMNGSVELVEVFGE
jgi:uncharacterized protein (TIGR02217 family)